MTSPFVVEADVHGVRVAEQVVQVAEDLLIGAEEEHAEVVGLAVERVQLQRALDVAQVDELVDLAVRVAGDVAEHRLRVGGSFSRWIGMIGNSCLTAQLSGIDWNTEKLQKYVSESVSPGPAAPRARSPSADELAGS